MEENELKDAFWTPLFIVTGFSLLFFGGIMGLFGGSHAGLFLKLGVIGLVVGLISYMSDRHFNAIQAHSLHHPESPTE